MQLFPVRLVRFSWSLSLWRLGVAGLVLAGVGVPLVLPFLDLLHIPGAWDVWSDAPRLLPLASNTLQLMVGTIAVTLPAGVVLAVFLYRTDLPGRRLFRLLALWMLFIPLPLFTSAWQAALGAGGWLPLGWWIMPPPGDPDVSPTGLVWKPWAQGLAAAIWVHAAAGLPWVVVIVGQGLRWVERELEEDALTIVGPRRVLTRVSLVRCRAALWAAALWVALQTATEMTVTDMMQVRTFTEEIYTQLVMGDPLALARAVAVALPPVALIFLVLWVTARGLERTVPPLGQKSPVLIFRLGKWRGPLAVTVGLALAMLLGIPVGSLVWKMGLSGSPPAWSAAVAWQHWRTVLSLRGRLVAESLELAVLSGVLAAALALVVCWLAVGSKWFRFGTLVVVAAAWAVPAPLIGLGLKSAIDHLLDWTESPRLAVALYYGPSLLPVLWAQVLRFFPFAVAILWPVVRLVPRELTEAVRLDGAGPFEELTRLLFPLTRPALAQAVLAVAVLSLGELGAGKLVETPGSQTFAHEIFTQMHYGVTNDLAALCLVLLLVVAAGGLAYAGLSRFLERRASGREGGAG